MNAEQAAKLEQLAQLLEELPEKNFDMLTFGDGEEVFSADKPTVAEAIKCNTACCVAGWAAVLNFKEWPTWSNGLNLSEDSFREFFGVTSYEADRLCLDGFDMSAKEKAAEIREVVLLYPEEAEK